MNNQHKYDVCIAGGGLAGLSLAILLAKEQFKVLLIEKKSYPYHKVCGEYISNESYNFLINLGIPLPDLNLPSIDQVTLTDIHQHVIKEKLTLGGFGISRFKLDNLLAKKAKELGVIILENTQCNNYIKQEEEYEINTSSGKFSSIMLVAGFGRYAFGNFYKPRKQKENWVGVKYHIQYEHTKNEIALHTFNNGYCGISEIENNISCLCYLVKASLLKSYNNSIRELEVHELFKNNFLKEIFTDATFLYDKPLAISNITFEPKRPVDDGVFYIGDSAGSIAPLTGNGMSNAMRSAHLLSIPLIQFLKGELDRNELENRYVKTWNKSFKLRIHKGKFIQYFFCQTQLTVLFIKLLSLMPNLKKLIIKKTHGNRF